MRFIWKPTGFEAVKWEGVLTEEIVDFLNLRSDTIGVVANPPRVSGLTMWVFEGTSNFDKIYIWEERGRRYNKVVPGDWIVKEMFPYGFYAVSDAFLKTMAEPLD